MGTVSRFTMGNYHHQPVAVYLFIISVNLPFMLEFKSDFVKDITSANMSHLFAGVELLIKRTRFELKHKTHIYRFHKQINNNRLARVVPRRKNAHSAHWLSFEMKRTSRKYYKT